MKLLIVTERFHPEEFIINDLAAQWAERGLNVEVLTQVPSYPYGKVFPGYANRLYGETTWNSIRIKRFFTITGYRNSLVMKLLNYLSFVITGSIAAISIAGKYDRIFIFHTGPLTMAIPGVLAGLFHKKPVAIWTFDVWPDTVYAYGFKKTRLLAWFLDRIVAFVYGNCFRIFVSCEGFRDRISPYAPGKPIGYFPNWPVVTPESSSSFSAVKLSDKFNFTFAGNIGTVQNLENVVRGFGLAVSVNDDIQLNLIGDGSALEHLKKIVASEAIRNIVFWGRKKQEEMPAYFAASDVLVISLNDHPVFNLTVPGKFQAYLAFSKPIYCVMNGEVRRIVERHNTGICASPGNTEDIKNGFLKLYALRGEGLRSFSKNSRALLDSSYNKTKITESMTAELLASS